MGNFFSMDGPFYKFGSILADIMILSFVWVFFSIPLFTIGASTTALFYVTTKRISNHEGYLLRDFWKSFKSNFVLATLSWLVIIVVGYILYINIRNINLVGNLKTYILPFQLCFFIELILVAIYIFPLISRFEMKFFSLFRTAFFMANKHIFTSVLMLAIGIATVLFVYLYPLFFVISMGTYAFATSFFLVKIFKKYRPEMDTYDDIEENTSFK